MRLSFLEIHSKLFLIVRKRRGAVGCSSGLGLDIQHCTEKKEKEEEVI
jgi:hypothetical protein